MNLKAAVAQPLSSLHFLAAVDNPVLKAALRERALFSPFAVWISFSHRQIAGILALCGESHIPEIHEKTMRIAFLHTAVVHVATFDQIFDNLDSNVQLNHHVDASLLERARQDGIEAVRADVETRLEELSSADAVLCTCSTLGPLADIVAKSFKTIIRIDRPLMQQACADGEKILVALCLDSTRDATLDLLNECAKDAGQNISPIVVICRNAWALFEAGDMEAYAASIVESVKSKIEEEPTVKSIVLAQASMRVAETMLLDIGIPVRSSPVLAAKRCLEVAQQSRNLD